MALFCFRFPEESIPEDGNITLLCLFSGSMALCGLDSPFRNSHKKVLLGVFNITPRCLIAGSVALCGLDSPFRDPHKKVVPGVFNITPRC